MKIDNKPTLTVGENAFRIYSMSLCTHMEDYGDIETDWSVTIQILNNHQTIQLGKICLIEYENIVIEAELVGFQKSTYSYVDLRLAPKKEEQNESV